METGRELWKQNLGSVQKASAVFADGKIYIGAESGKFYILRPHADRCDVLSEVELPISENGITSQKIPEPVVAAAAVARGRVYFVSSDHLYAIGPKQTAGHPWKPVVQTMERGQGDPAWVQVEPTELVLKPGQTIDLHARLYDSAGRFLREEQSAAWSLDHLKPDQDHDRIAGTSRLARLVTGRPRVTRLVTGLVDPDSFFRLADPGE